MQSQSWPNTAFSFLPGFTWSFWRSTPFEALTGLSALSDSVQPSYFRAHSALRWSAAPQNHQMLHKNVLIFPSMPIPLPFIMFSSSSQSPFLTLTTPRIQSTRDTWRQLDKGSFQSPLQNPSWSLWDEENVLWPPQVQPHSLLPWSFCCEMA